MLGLLIGCLGWMSAACAESSPPERVPPTPTVLLTPYHTLTASPIPEGVQREPTPTATPAPSATPFTYTIQPGDTLLAIAYRFGVSVDELRKFNPGLDPNLLPVDTEIVVPIGSGEQPVIPSPTPIRLIAGRPQCHRTATGGVWCFVPVLNDQDRAVEALSARVVLVTAEGQFLAEMEALPPLNLIPPGEALPLVAYFAGEIPPGFQATAHLNTSFPLREEDERYLPVEWRFEGLDLASDGKQARVHGEVLLRPEAAELPGPGVTPEPGAEATTGVVDAIVWVVAIAYGPDQEIAGVRRWEGERSLTPGEPEAVELQVFSVGPSITRVKALVEALPLRLFEQP